MYLLLFADRKYDRRVVFAAFGVSVVVVDVSYCFVVIVLDSNHIFRSLITAAIDCLLLMDDDNDHFS